VVFFHQINGREGDIVVKAESFAGSDFRMVQPAADGDYFLEFTALYQVSGQFGLPDDQPRGFFYFAGPSDGTVVQRLLLEKIPLFIQPQICGAVILPCEINVIAVANSEEVFFRSPVGFENFIVAVRREPVGQKFGENLIPVSAERMTGSEIVFLKFLAIQYGNGH